MLSRLLLVCVCAVSVNVFAEPEDHGAAGAGAAAPTQQATQREQLPSKSDAQLLAEAPELVQRFYEHQMELDKNLPKDEQPKRIGDVVHYLCGDGKKICSYDGLTNYKSGVDIKSIREFKGMSVGLEDGKLKFSWKVGPWRDVMGGEELKQLETSKYAVFGIKKKGEMHAYMNTNPEIKKFDTRGQAVLDEETGQVSVKYYPILDKEEMKLEYVGIEGIKSITPKDQDLVLRFYTGQSVGFMDYLKERAAEAAAEAAAAEKK